MALTADTWPIAAAMLPFGPIDLDGTIVQDASVEHWTRTLTEVADAGFSDVDLTDCWVRAGDLSAARLSELGESLEGANLRACAISAIRRSVIDGQYGDEHLAYSHRTIDAAAVLGAPTVSVGLHQPLTAAQKERLWFWTAEGHRDLPDDVESWNLAVERFRELGRHAAEVGVVLSLEMYEDTYLGTADSAVRMVQEIGLENVGLNPDIGNLVRLHRPIESWREAMAKTLPYANYWHVKNYFRDENPSQGLYTSTPAPMEFGMIDYRESIKIALRAGFQGAICVEHYGGDGLSVCATNQRYLRERVLPRDEEYPLGTSRVRQPAASLASEGANR